MTNMYGTGLHITKASNQRLVAYHIAGCELAPALRVGLLEQCAVVTD